LFVRKAPSIPMFISGNMILVECRSLLSRLHSSSSPKHEPSQRRTFPSPPGSPPPSQGSTKIWDTLYPASHHASRTPAPGQLPPSAPALAAFVASCALVVPFMAQVWYTGPVARRGTGDLGLVVAFVCAVGLYALLRGIQFRGERRRGKMWRRVDAKAKTDILPRSYFRR